MKIYQECCYPPVSTLDLTWENSGSLYWLKVEGEYFLFGRGLLAEAVWSEWWPPFSPGRQRFSAKQNVLSVRGQGGAGGHGTPLLYLPVSVSCCLCWSSSDIFTKPSLPDWTCPSSSQPESVSASILLSLWTSAWPGS